MELENKIFKRQAGEDFESYALRIAALKDSLENATWTTIANIINANEGIEFSADKYRKQYKKYQNSLNEGEQPQERERESIPSMADSFVTTNDKESISVNYEKGETTSYREIPLSSKQIADQNELLKAHGFDPDHFQIKTATNTKTNRTTPNGDSFVYTSRIVVKPKEGIVTEVKEIAEFFKTFDSQKTEGRLNNYNTEETLLIPLYDLHWGRLPDIEDFKEYNIEKEKEKIINHIQKYMAKFNNRHFKKIYLVIGQDFLNSSFTGYTSSQSHLQSNAVDFRTMFKTGAELLITIIDIFSLQCNLLEVIGSLGNHDTAEEVALFSLLKAYYRNIDSVNVDDGTAPRKYFKIGNTGVGLGHLDKEAKRAFGLMQVEAKDIWCNTKTHIFIAGHLHHFNVSNENGVEVFRVPSICSADRWTKEQGYVMNVPKTMCFVFNEEEGLTETHFMYL